MPLSVALLWNLLHPHDPTKCYRLCVRYDMKCVQTCMAQYFQYLHWEK